MRLKLTRNIGRDDLKKFGLVAEDKDMAASLAKYSEGTVHEFEKEAGEVLVKRGLAEADDGVDTRPLRAVAPTPAVTAPAIARPESFADNPHSPAKKADK